MPPFSCDCLSRRPDPLSPARKPKQQKVDGATQQKPNLPGNSAAAQPTPALPSDGSEAALRARELWEHLATDFLFAMTTAAAVEVRTWCQNYFYVVAPVAPLTCLKNF